MHIIIDDLEGPEVAALLQEHLASMFEQSPPESCHALDLSGLKHPSVTFWSVWDGSSLMGCGAIKELDPYHGELKSMRTATPYLKQGVAKKLLQHILDEAKRRGYRKVSLETGSMVGFEPARQLYSRFGFSYCEPFGDYIEDPNSVFMTLELPVTEPLPNPA